MCCATVLRATQFRASLSGRADRGTRCELPAVAAWATHGADARDVVLQALKEEEPLGAECNDKFLIQSMLITAEKETVLPLQDIS